MTGLEQYMFRGRLVFAFKAPCQAMKKSNGLGLFSTRLWPVVLKKSLCLAWWRNLNEVSLIREYSDHARLVTEFAGSTAMSSQLLSRFLRERQRSGELRNMCRLSRWQAAYTAYMPAAWIHASFCWVYMVTRNWKLQEAGKAASWSLMPEMVIAYFVTDLRFQISLAYSSIVRSDENLPTLATFRMAFSAHCCGFA